MLEKFFTEETLSKVKKYFDSLGYVEFAVIFGSYGRGSPFPFSDIDIGIYTKKEIDLLELGGIITNLEKIFHKNVDVIVLNDLHLKNTVLAYNIAKDSHLIYCKDLEKWVNFKTWAFIYYLDYKPTYEKIKTEFKKRRLQKC